MSCGRRHLCRRTERCSSGFCVAASSLPWLLPGPRRQVAHSLTAAGSSCRDGRAAWPASYSTAERFLAINPWILCWGSARLVWTTSLLANAHSVTAASPSLCVQVCRRALRCFQSNSGMFGGNRDGAPSMRLRKREKQRRKDGHLVINSGLIVPSFLSGHAYSPTKLSFFVTGAGVRTTIRQPVS